VISGSRGSGTVFLGGCNLRCVYCQNHRISQPGPDSRQEGGIAQDAGRLADIFLELQETGCHNINWVSPSHQVPQLLEALEIAVSRGFSLPIVYNSNAYDNPETLTLLDGIVDIYLPDLKYAVASEGLRYSRVPAYPARARAAIKEMCRQVGDDWTEDDGILRRGILIRLLVLPNDLAGIRENLRWISRTLPESIGISLMAQYHPDHRAVYDPEFILAHRKIFAGEWEAALRSLEEFAGNRRVFVQDYLTAPEYYLPDFSDPERPFVDIRDFEPSSGGDDDTPKPC